MENIKHKTMSSNIIVPLDNKLYAQSEEVKKESGPFPKKSDALSEKVDKGENKNLIWWRKPSLLLFQQKIRLTKSTKKRNHKHPKKQLIPPKK